MLCHYSAQMIAPFEHADHSSFGKSLRPLGDLRKMVAKGRTAREIQQRAIRQGMLDLRRSALIKVADGVTTTDELARLIPAERFATNC